MGESLDHINYLQIIAKYTLLLLPEELTPHICVDLPESIKKPERTIGNYIPDLYYKDSQYLIIGEAKTEHDVDRKHSIDQYKSYIYEASLFDVKSYIIICTSLYSYAKLKNLIKKIKIENNTTTEFHLINDMGHILIL